jgi:GTP cyclohydrolase I
MFKKGQRIGGKKASLEEALLAMFREMGVPEAEWRDLALDISGTPARVAKMWKNELLSSYQPGALADLKRRFTCFDIHEAHPLIVEGPIDFHSQCAHHMLPFSGEAYVGYLPGAKLVGASKLARVVEHYSRMLQIQERMGQQVATFIAEQAGAPFTAVMIVASHMCMQVRGIRKAGAKMITTTIVPTPTDGKPVNASLISEFYQAVAMIRRT